MPETNQYTFTHKELLELMIKQADLHEGRWVLQANFGFSAANVGPTEDQTVPSAIAALNHLGIQRATEGSPSGLTLDAAEVNPAPTKRRARKSQRS